MEAGYDTTGLTPRERDRTFGDKSNEMVLSLGSRILGETRDEEVGRFAARAREVNGPDSLKGWYWGSNPGVREPMYGATALVAEFRQGGRTEEVWMPVLTEEKSGNSAVLTPDGTFVKAMRGFGNIEV